MNEKEIKDIEQAVNDIRQTAERTTSGNVAHNIANIKAGCDLITLIIKEHNK